MKPLFYIICFALTITGCKTTKDYLSRSGEDKTFFDVVKRLNKKSTDENAAFALPVVFKEVQTRHLGKIETYNSYTTIDKWDKIAGEYNILQSMFDAIDNSATAGALVTANSYQNEIAAVKYAAAEDYYQQAVEYAASGERDDLKRAYKSFNTADKWVNGYKDSKRKMDTVFNNSIINIQVNPVHDNSFFFNTGWGNTGYDFSNEYFQQNLVRDLGGKYASRYPAKFYTDWEARRDDVQPDWVVDLNLRNMDMPLPTVYNYTNNRSRQVETGVDTAGKKTYQTVYATVYVQRQSFSAYGQMDVQLTDVNTRKSIAYNNYSDRFDWQEETASYSGDSRALSSSDWALVNNRGFNIPRKEDILNELYRKIYPQVKNGISYQVNW